MNIQKTSNKEKFDWTALAYGTFTIGGFCAFWIMLAVISPN